MFNRTTLYILIVALAAGLGLWAAQHWWGERAHVGPELQVVKLFDQPRELPPFALQQSDGTPLVPGELKGHWTLVFLGFTHCPDVCPTTLAQLAQAQKLWATQPDSTRPRVLFVSVDPDRDTPDAIGEYAHAFHRDTLAATTDIPALEAFTRSLSLVFMKVPALAGAPADQYSIDHSATLVVLDPQARMAGVVPRQEQTTPGGPSLDPKAIAADLTALTQASMR
jgi:protein SCO1/2